MIEIEDGFLKNFPFSCLFWYFLNADSFLCVLQVHYVGKLLKQKDMAFCANEESLGVFSLVYVPTSPIKHASIWMNETIEGCSFGGMSLGNPLKSTQV